MMSGNQKGFPTVVFAFALVTLLSCFSPVSSYFTLPRVTRTSDAIIIDYEGVGYSPFSLGRGYGQYVDPGFVPLPALNPYGMFFGGLSYFGRQTPPAPAPAPAATCGRGPPPPARSAISERVEGSASAPVVASRTWPFLVVLRRSTADPNIFFCSGTLISDSRVLLAAQCLEQLSVYDISTVTVLIGLTSVTAGTAGTPATGNPGQSGFVPAVPPVPGSSVVQMTRRISRVVIHSGYNAATYANDIAIISLDMPVVFSNRVAPACLPAASTDPDQHSERDAAVMGWGPVARGTASTAFRQGKVSIVANDQDCRSQTGYGSFVTVNNICITGTNVFTCAADVGGPVVLNTAAPTATSPVWTVVGINSFTAADCASTGLKTRVSAFAAWIATYMV